MDWNKMVYDSGDFFLPKPIKQMLDKHIYDTPNKLLYINGWTFIHYFSGMLMGMIYLYLGKKIDFYYYYNLFIIHTIWELWQILIGMTKIWELNGIIDTTVDTIVYMIGAYVLLQIHYIWRLH
jgi:hypothetical protein